ncbi:hypothetical protein O0I10_006244 [Lichtheimia ornata]|uniref:F-box domain-containing protein n=1 Tax=Lichtheimia ornata TaxID=688661 RepID=A0AAD7V3K9_9FUNG|nr:uncharacterized protein O0I10_006244 [Lichtheimia ornata]KAJ8657973.1 hypothetical protein O0I10_006244 [Lichtheimia ornata]
MDDWIWNGLCEQPTVKASSEKYAKLVYDATTQLHEPIHSILSTLNRRAIGLTKCADFDAALRDAKVMQKLSPSSALGYIREASIYSEQGKQHQAIHICNEGLSMMDTKDTQYATLYQVKADAEQRQSTRIDFISKLPIDIVITTLIPMFMDDTLMDSLRPTPYIFVSNAWRDRIAECFGGLSFEVAYHEEERDDKCLNIVKFAQHTKKLQVSLYSQGTWLSDLLSENDFCSLRGLTINEFSSIHVDRFISSLASIGNTLTDLDIMLDGPVLHVPTIVTACPNLVSLCIYDTPDVDVSSLPMAPWPALTSLSLTFSHTDITCDQIVEIWKRFPSLKKLDLHPCSDIQSALIAHQYAPWIQDIYLLMRDEGIQFIYVGGEKRSEGIGITSLSIRTETEEICNNTTAIVKQHHNTLEQIEWDMDTSHDTNTIDNLQYPQLKDLHINMSGWQIPRNAPLLQELEMTLETINAHPAVLDAIPPNLNKLALHLQGLTTVTKPSIERYLDRLARQHQLKQLIIDFDSDNDNVNDLLKGISRHDQLERLEITFPNHWASYPLEQFLDRLVKGCPHLHSLDLRSKTAPSANVMNTLKRLTHLKEFGFLVFCMGDYESFWNEILTFRHLKSLTIYLIHGGRDDKVKYLKEQRPDMQIIVERYVLEH